MIWDLLFPNRCLQCNRIITSAELVCGICFEQIHFMHYNFTENSELREKCNLLFPVENAYALMQFEEESLSRKIVHQLKYAKREKAGKILAEWVSERIDLKESIPDLIVTVPLHPRKLRERGYNQLHLFSDVLSEKLGIPCDHQLIKRNYYQKAQATKNRAKRDKTDNLFSCTREISGKHILVIDDVFTTGNTLSSVAWEILSAGENRVSILVMAEDKN